MSETQWCAALATLLATPEHPQLGPGPRPGTKSVAQLDSALDAILGKQNSAASKASLLRALVYLWHDHLDTSHELAQGIETAHGSYLHAIMHRREPDYANAKYWFNRVGKHPCYKPLAEESRKILSEPANSALRSKLLPGGQWSSSAFVDACAAAARPDDDKDVPVLRAIQAAEFHILLVEFAEAH